jgi:hypothetical protein
MELVELLHAEPQFETLTPREKICLFSWYLHTHGDVDVLTTGAVRECYRKLNIVEPNVALYMPRMVSSAPIQLLQVRGGYKLEGNLRRQMDEKYGQHPTVVRVQALLAELPDKIPDLAERVFLQETLNCYKVQAFRASIVMAWNLAFDHLLRWIVNDPARLAKFNAAIVVRYRKRSDTVVAKFDDFSDEFKESEIIEVCRTADLISKNQAQILGEKLTRRNIAAHPSSVSVTQPQADDAISDLVNNVVLTLP